MARLLGIWLAFFVIHAQAQGYPQRPIRVYIAFAAGGNLAMEAGARAAPDGHTLVMVGPAAAINGTLYKKLAFSLNRDLVPISLMAWGPYAMYVSATLPGGERR